MLSCNKIGQLILECHSGLTAEGDNRVLMQKVSKELMELARTSDSIKTRIALAKNAGLIRSKSNSVHSIDDLKDRGMLQYLFSIREGKLLGSLIEKMARIPRAAVFDVWMKQESDLVQATALAFIEREVLDSSLAALQTCSTSLGKAMDSIISLFVLKSVEDDIGWFLSEEVLSPLAGKLVYRGVRELCKELAAISEELVSGFGIPDHLVAAPINKNWKEFNEIDNRGELLPEFR